MLREARLKQCLPTSRTKRWSAPLPRSISQGRASYTVEFSHYEDVPAHLIEQIIAAAAKAREEAG